MKIGLFGGTFNPVHSGHVLIAEWIRCELFLDTIYFIPTAVPPHRSDDSSIAAIAHRLEMVRRAVQDNPSFEVSEIESNPDIMSYTADTVQSFHETYSLSKKIYSISLAVITAARLQRGNIRKNSRRYAELPLPDGLHFTLMQFLKT